MFDKCTHLSLSEVMFILMKDQDNNIAAIKEANKSNQLFAKTFDYLNAFSLQKKEEDIL